MRTYVIPALLVSMVAFFVGFILAARGSTSFELEVLKADMAEAGPQYEAAVLQYPRAAPRIYALYGHTSELREVFRKYGHNQIVPVIEKCLVEGDRILELGAQFDELTSSLLDRKLAVSRVEPAECGWRAILLTLVAGNNFLGQYVIDEEGRAHLLPGSTLLAIIKRFTTSGVGVLEKKLVLGENPTLKEWGLAALDVAVVGFAGKSVAAAVKRGIARSARPAIGYRLAAARTGIMSFAGTYAPRIAKYATVGGIAYLALYHPRVITGAAGVVADSLGIPPLLVQTLVWGTILLVPIWILGMLSLLLRSLLTFFLFPAARLARQMSHALVHGHP